MIPANTFLLVICSRFSFGFFIGKIFFQNFRDTMNNQKSTTANKYLINQDLIRFSSQRRKMPFDKMKRGDCFWVIGHEKIATKFQDEQHVWHTSLEEPVLSPKDQCFINIGDNYMFYQGAGTTWMDNIPQSVLDKLHNRKIYFEMEFIDITPKGCFHLAATGRQAEYDYVLAWENEHKLKN